MLFSSLTFLFLFLPLFFLCYFIFKKRYARNVVLFVFSVAFYAWGEPLYMFLMLFSVAINYFFAIGIGGFHGKNDTRSAKTLLILAVIANLSLLGFFKYTGFAVENINAIFGLELPLPQIVLPVGISFYTFQILSYVIDVYRKETQVQKNFIYLGAYLAAFPQLIAGPVVRYKTVAEELDNRTETMDDVAAGVRRFLSGLMKKVLIANTMGLVSENILANNAVDYGFTGAWIAMIAYSLQIYFDFSGYSDMAIGMGRMMGFHYLENFNYPYISKSVSEFWRRWHISMSTFFRDYVYIPMGGNRVSKPRWIFNVFEVWFLTGLWHGASWNFIIWGVYFGFLLMIEKLFIGKYIEKIPVLNHVYALICIIFGWVIFCSADITQMSEIIKAMVGVYGVNNGSVMTALVLQRSGVNTIFLVMLAFGIILSTPISKIIKSKLEKYKFGGYVIDIAAICGLVLSVIQSAIGAYDPFIYFRF